VRLAVRAAAVVPAAAFVLAGCSWLGLERPRMPDLPDVDLPSLPRMGSDEPEPPLPAPGQAVEILPGTAPEVEFHARASAFYQRLTGRRFNSITTFRDPGLREYFASEESFSEYFSDLARDLADAHFERNRPLTTSIEEFAVEGPGRSRVRVRITGDNGKPLRFWGTSLVREDLWERRDGEWSILPSAL
jgi:hypothetical protein